MERAVIWILQFLLRKENRHPIHVGVILMTEQTVLYTGSQEVSHVSFLFSLSSLPDSLLPLFVEDGWFSPRREAAGSVTSVSASLSPV